MKIYEVKRAIDGYGGVMSTEYFKDYDTAKQFLLSDGPVAYDTEEKKYYVCGMKETIVTEEDNHFNLIGIVYPEKDQDEWSLHYCRISITPITVDFPLDDHLFILYYKRGYKHWFMSSINDMSLTQEEYYLNNQPVVIKLCQTKKKARKYAARSKAWKTYPRAWVSREFDEKASPMGEGMDYLSIEKVALK